MYSPKTLYIQLANQCNNNCTTCIFFNNPEYIVTDEFMSDAVIEKILCNIRDIKSIEKIFYGPVYGEAQIHPKFYEMVEKIKEIRPSIKVGLLTNGKLIDKKELKKFKGDDIYISILGNKTNPETYESITGLKWKDLRKKAELILKEGLSYAFYINVDSFSDLEEVLADLSDLPNFHAVYTIREYRNLISISNRSTVQKYRFVGKKFKKIRNDYNPSQVPMCDYSPVVTSGCTCYDIVDEYITILSNGDLLICPCDTSLKSRNGNILDNTLIELFNNTYMNNIRMMIHKRAFPTEPCIKNCSTNGVMIPGTPLKL